MRGHVRGRAWARACLESPPVQILVAIERGHVDNMEISRIAFRVNLEERHISEGKTVLDKLEYTRVGD